MNSTMRWIIFAAGSIAIYFVLSSEKYKTQLGGWYSGILVIAIGLLFFFLIIHPDRTRQKLDEIKTFKKYDIRQIKQQIKGDAARKFGLSSTAIPEPANILVKILIFFGYPPEKLPMKYEYFVDGFEWTGQEISENDRGRYIGQVEFRVTMGKYKGIWKAAFDQSANLDELKKGYTMVQESFAINYVWSKKKNPLTPAVSKLDSTMREVGHYLDEEEKRDMIRDMAVRQNNAQPPMEEESSGGMLSRFRRKKKKVKPGYGGQVGG